ncbi:GspL/Epsl periplasmic domain-containing protein [Candidatus Coxiella mudrowiae]|uniref:GspL/Epsl periplasmic domain-containing protein n=1 Tax=Candidatus Coxiella mudrowiae TaxID=2054173 RepID=UPI000C28889D|nr:GspL/Epsl periplasmic domain-containing protein [Candidatus Coxiella mudrowiae]
MLFHENIDPKNLPINKNIGESPALLLWFGFFLLLGTRKLVEWTILKMYSDHLQKETVPTFQQLFPYLKSITYAREQISRELHLLTKSKQRINHIHLLNRVGEIPDQYSEINVESKSYQNSQLVLQFTTNQLSTVGDLVHVLNQAKLQMKRKMHNQNKKIIAEFDNPMIEKW